jgi:hypothetical protein
MQVVPVEVGEGVKAPVPHDFIHSDLGYRATRSISEGMQEGVPQFVRDDLSDVLIRHPVHDWSQEQQFVTVTATERNLMPGEPWLPEPGRVGRNIDGQESNVGRRREMLREDRVGSPVSPDQLTGRKRDASPGITENPGEATAMCLTVARQVQAPAGDDGDPIRSVRRRSGAIHGSCLACLSEVVGGQII